MRDITTKDDLDKIRWRWNTTGGFSVKSLYCFLQDGGGADRRFVYLWKIMAPLKVKIFVWLVLRKRVLTTDNLLKRGWNGEGRCSFCAEGNESGEHLFLTFHFSKDILSALLSDKTLLCVSSSPERL